MYEALLWSKQSGALKTCIIRQKSVTSCSLNPIFNKAGCYSVISRPAPINQYDHMTEKCPIWLISCGYDVCIHVDFIGAILNYNIFYYMQLDLLYRRIIQVI